MKRDKVFLYFISFFVVGNSDFFTQHIDCVSGNHITPPLADRKDNALLLEVQRTAKGIAGAMVPHYQAILECVEAIERAFSLDGMEKVRNDIPLLFEKIQSECRAIDKIAEEVSHPCLSPILKERSRNILTGIWMFSERVRKDSTRVQEYPEDFKQAVARWGEVIKSIRGIRKLIWQIDSQGRSSVYLDLQASSEETFVVDGIQKGLDYLTVLESGI